jgi:hypothetical protein
MMHRSFVGLLPALVLAMAVGSAWQCARAQTAGGTVSPADPIHVYQNRDFFGDDLAAPAVSASPGACGEACNAESRCVAFAYVTKTQLCYLKRSIQTSSDVDGTISGVLTTRTNDPVAQHIEVNLPRSGDLDRGTTACRVPDTAACIGCSVTCPQGTQAQCKRGSEAPNVGCVQTPLCRCEAQ